MPNTHVQYAYKKARDEWGESIANAIWRKFKNTKTRARATLAEDKKLKNQNHAAAQARSVIDEIVNRSAGPRGRRD